MSEYTETREPAPEPQPAEVQGDMLTELEALDVEARKEGTTVANVIKAIGQQLLGVFR
jgi:hypothetical protein